MGKPKAIVQLPDQSWWNITSLLGQEHGCAKISKNKYNGRYLSCYLAMLPANLDGYPTVCAFSTPDCRSACLNRSGMSHADSPTTDVILRGRIARRILWHTQREKFYEMLWYELDSLRKKAKSRHQILIARLNLLSDINWVTVKPSLFTDFSDVQFYGYTKNYVSMVKFCNNEHPHNNYLTFSRSEKNWEKCLDILDKRGNVVVPFNIKYCRSQYHKYPLPTKWNGLRVIDGDINDLRFNDPHPVIVGLRGKGRMRERGYVDNGFLVKEY